MNASILMQDFSPFPCYFHSFACSAIRAIVSLNDSSSPYPSQRPRSISIREGGSAADAIAESVELAQHAKRRVSTGIG